MILFKFRFGLSFILLVHTLLKHRLFEKRIDRLFFCQLFIILPLLVVDAFLLCLYPGKLLHFESGQLLDHIDDDSWELKLEIYLLKL